MPSAPASSDQDAGPTTNPIIRFLTELRPGDTGQFHGTELIEAERQLLSALGLVDRSRLRLCKAGDPWIVQVRGTRIGLSDAVARRLQVVTDT